MSSVHSSGRYIARFAYLHEAEQHILLDMCDCSSVPLLEPSPARQHILVYSSHRYLDFCSGAPATSCDYDSAFEDDWEISSQAGEAPSTAEEEPQSTAICTPAPACNLQPQMLIQQMGNHPILACLAAILASEAAKHLRDLVWEIPLSVARFVSCAAQASYYEFVNTEDSLKALKVGAEHLPPAAREESLWASGTYRRAMYTVCGYILTGMHVDHALMCCVIMSFAQLALAAHGNTGASRLVEGSAWAFFHKPGNAIIFLLIGDVWILSASKRALGWLSSLGAQ